MTLSISFSLLPGLPGGLSIICSCRTMPADMCKKRQRLRISGCAVFKVEMKLKQSSGNYDSAILITANLITANLITARVCLLNVRLL